LLSKFLSRERIAEVSKFGTVGGVAFLVHNAIFLLANGPLDQGPTVSKVIAMAIATFVSYIGNRSWSFASRKAEDQRRELMAFLVVNGIGLGIEWIPLGISHYLLGFHTHWADWFSGVIIGTAIGTVFRYFAYRQAVFTGA